MGIEQKTEQFKKLLTDIYDNVNANKDIDVNELVVQIMEKLKEIIS